MVKNTIKSPSLANSSPLIQQLIGYDAAVVHMFPPHPLAVAPTSELGLSSKLSFADRASVNQAFAIRKKLNKLKFRHVHPEN
jgi:hypothetical protein